MFICFVPSQNHSEIFKTEVMDDFLIVTSFPKVFAKINYRSESFKFLNCKKSTKVHYRCKPLKLLEWIENSFILKAYGGEIINEEEFIYFHEKPRKDEEIKWLFFIAFNAKKESVPNYML